MRRSYDSSVTGVRRLGGGTVPMRARPWPSRRMAVSGRTRATEESLVLPDVDRPWQWKRGLALSVARIFTRFRRELHTVDPVDQAQLGIEALGGSSAASSVTSSVSGAPSSPARSTPPWPDLNHQIPRPAPPHATTLCGRSCIGPCQRYGLSVEPQARASGHPFNPCADSRYTRGQLASLISPCPSHS